MARARPAQESEALPEADRLGDFPHPRHTHVLIGQEEAERALSQAFASGRMHHAWLLTGRAGVGKATLAYRLARYALARPEERDPAGTSLEVPDQSAAARQVDALSHPGLLVLRRGYDAKSKRFGTTIPVDEVRRLKAFLGLTAGDGAWRVVIVDSADDLNLNAANALLKSLEEPPRRALFLLVSSEPGRLLVTIRSRCRRIDLRPLEPEPWRQAVEQALRAAGLPAPKDEAWGQLARLSEGSVRRALQLAAEGGLELNAEIEAMFARLPKVDWPAAHTLADALALGAQEQRYEAFLDLLLGRVADLAGVRARGAGAPGELSLARRLIPEGQAAAWAGMWQTLVRDKAAADELNLDRKALILRVLSRLQAATAV